MLIVLLVSQCVVVFASICTGDFSYHALADAIRQEGCTTVNGSVTISGEELVGDHSWVVDLYDLEEVTEDFIISNNPSLLGITQDALLSVGGSFIVKDNPLLASISFHALTEVGELLDVSNNTLLTAVHVPVLTCIGDMLTLMGNPALASVVINKLETCGGLHVLHSPFLSSLKLSSLMRIEGSAVLERTSLETLGLPLLTAVKDGLTLRDNPVLRAVHFGALVSVGSVAKGRSVGFSLTDTGLTWGTFRISNNAMLEEMSAPRLTSVQSIVVDSNAALLDLSCFSAVEEVGPAPAGGAIQVTNNRRLKLVLSFARLAEKLNGNPREGRIKFLLEGNPEVCCSVYTLLRTAAPYAESFEVYADTVCTDDQRCERDGAKEAGDNDGADDKNGDDEAGSGGGEGGSTTNSDVVVTTGTRREETSARAITRVVADNEASASKDDEATARASTRASMSGEGREETSGPYPMDEDPLHVRDERRSAGDLEGAPATTITSGRLPSARRRRQHVAEAVTQARSSGFGMFSYVLVIVTTLGTGAACCLYSRISQCLSSSIAGARQRKHKSMMTRMNEDVEKQFNPFFNASSSFDT